MAKTLLLKAILALEKARGLSRARYSGFGPLRAQRFSGYGRVGLRKIPSGRVGLSGWKKPDPSLQCLLLFGSKYLAITV